MKHYSYDRHILEKNKEYMEYMPVFGQDNPSDTERKKPMHSENAILKSMVDILCQQNLITSNEKSRLILLIDKERES